MRRGRRGFAAARHPSAARSAKKRRLRVGQRGRTRETQPPRPSRARAPERALRPTPRKPTLDGAGAHRVDGARQGQKLVFRIRRRVSPSNRSRDRFCVAFCRPTWLWVRLRPHAVSLHFRHSRPCRRSRGGSGDGRTARLFQAARGRRSLLPGARSARHLAAAHGCQRHLRARGGRSRPGDGRSRQPCAQPASTSRRGSTA